MRLPKSGAALIVLCCGLLLCAGNLWFTAQRSTIPLSINGTLADKTIGREKHPGTDDVFWLRMTNGEKLHVDQEIFDAVRPGERLQKESWSRRLEHGNQFAELQWSNDVTGMLRVMPVAVGIMVLLAVGIWRQQRSA